MHNKTSRIRAIFLSAVLPPATHYVEAKSFKSVLFDAHSKFECSKLDTNGYGYPPFIPDIPNLWRKEMKAITLLI